MAVRPLYQKYSQERIVRSDITVITNVREDHQEEMGETLGQIADAMSMTIPDNGVLITAERPETSLVGIALAVATLMTMPPLARAKARVGAALRSQATIAEGRQNILCAYLSGVLLVGLLANTLVGAWWLDAVAALVIGALAVREGIEAWQGDQ
ncbi:MAG TPA: hypothetical protein PLV41_08465, partial [Miltoncostaeales bacterium]|nr:hypothetical protein [Miltoncostaeales bacterium]